MAKAQLAADFQGVLSQIKEWFYREKDKCKVFGILVVGETGAGKSTLINNLMLQDIVKEGNTLESQTFKIDQLRVTVEGVPVVLYDTPGLGDSRGDHDASYLKDMKNILDSNEIQLVLYCFKLSETRMRDSLIRTFAEYHKIGVKWERTVMALTFADYLPVPSKEKKKPGFQMSQYFNGKVAALRDHIQKTLVERVGVKQEAAKAITVCPSTSDPEDLLPNGERWFVPLWLDILDLLSPGAMAHYLQIHAGNIKSSPSTDTAVTVSTPTIASAQAVPSTNSDRQQQEIPLDSKDEEKLTSVIVDKVISSSTVGDKSGFLRRLFSFGGIRTLIRSWFS